MELKIENFIPMYPSYENIPKELDLYNDNPENTFFKKEEFYMLDKIEEKPKIKGTALQHQKNSAIYMSPFTLNDEVLLMDALGSGKCVHPDTLVYIKDMGEIKISKLWSNNITYRDNEGDWIKLENMYTSNVFDKDRYSKVNYIYRQKIYEYLYKITLEDGRYIIATGKHKLFTNDNWLDCFKIFSMLSGDNYNPELKIYTNNDQMSITKIGRFLYDGYVYDLEVNKTHSYLANGIITHNTCSAITIAENAKKVNPSLKQALIIVKNDSIRKNFINELVFGPCMDNRYKPENYDNLTEGEKIRRINKLINERYMFTTFETFAAEIKKYSNDYIKRIFSNRVIIIDEGHNIRIQPKKKKIETINVYESIHRFLHLLTNRKIVIMTATPMRDRPEEFASIMNLILPLNQQLPTGKDFVNIYFKENKLINKNKLYDYIRGRIGYTRGSEGGVVKLYEGSLIDNMKKILIYPSIMSDFQTELYSNAFKEDIGANKEINNELIEDESEEGKTMGLYNKSRQASLFTFPTNDDDYLDKKGSEYYLKSSFKYQLTENGKATKNKIIENIRKYSSIYADTIKEIINNPDENVFVYNKYVHGSGAILFSELLKLVGLERTRGHINIDTSNKVSKYALIIGEATSDNEIERILKIYNDPLNKYGKYIQVIIGSGVISEGKSLFNVRQIHIQTPHWNNSETEQSIGRGLRAFSHEDLKPEERVVKIYRHAAIPNKKEIKSINLLMYKISEDKDLLIKQIERLAKESSFNCGFNLNRNILDTDIDGSRECDYGVCKYQCKNLTAKSDDKKIYDTYNLLYANEDIDSIITIIKKKFRYNFSYDIKELIKGLEIGDKRKIPEMVIIRALKEIIDKSIIIINKYGMPSYLKEDHNLYFLVDDIKSTNSFPLTYYCENPPIQHNRNFQDIIKYAQYNFIVDDKSYIIENYTEDEDKSVITNQLDGLLPELQELFLEKSIIGNKKNTNINRDIIIDYYKNNIVTLNDRIVSTLLKDDDKYRCLLNNTNEWIDCESNIEDKLDEAIQIKKINLENNPFGYYGILGKDKKFKIKKVLKEEKEDNREKTRGIVCMTVVPIGNIVEYILDINKNGYNMKLPKNVNIEMPPNSRKQFEKDINKKLEENGYHAKHKELVKGKKVDVLKKLKVNIKDMSDEQLKATYYWLCKANKEDLCNNLKLFFTENDLIFNEK